MLTRKCVGRIFKHGSSWGCPKEGVMCGKDGRWRCREHHAEKYEVESERAAIQSDGPPKRAA